MAYPFFGRASDSSWFPSATPRLEAVGRVKLDDEPERFASGAVGKWIPIVFCDVGVFLLIARSPSADNQ